MQTQWRPSSQPLNAHSLLDALGRHPVVVLHFWARWNRIDRQFDALLQAVRSDFADRIFFGSVNADDPEHYDFIRQCQVNNLPACACFVHGKRAGIVIGCRSLADLRRQFAGWLAEAEKPSIAPQRTAPPTAVLGVLKRFLGGPFR